MPFAVETEDLVKVYRSDSVETYALRGVNLRVKVGEVVAVVGPSGSGKSTLLNLIGALDRPTSGRVVVDGVDTSTLRGNELAEFRNTKIGFIFQSFNLISRLSALKNVEMPLMVRKVPRREREEKALSLLRELGLEEKAQRRPTQLSGGEQQRVAVARALIQDPAILLGDEPTGNLDTKNTAVIIELFRKINRRTGKTFVIITHNMEVAKRCHRIVYLKDGLVDREEVPNEV
jgi:putative ABC transport system ATP-binding protein